MKFVLLASFNLQKFVDFHKQQLPTAADIVLVDKSGNILVTPAGSNWSQRAGVSLANTDMFRSATERTAGLPREITGLDGSKQYWAANATHASRDAGLYVMVGMSKDGLVAAANSRLYEELVIVVIMSMLLFAGVWTLAEIGVRRQVGRIAAMAKSLGSGNLSSRIAAPYPSGELGGLMIELNATAESLQRQHDSIDELNRRLRQSQVMEADTKKFLDAVIENIPLAITVKVVDGDAQSPFDWRATLVNKSYEELMGIPRADLIGKTVRDLYPADISAKIAAYDLETLRSNTSMIAREYPVFTVNHGARLVTSRKVAIRDACGKPRYMLTVLDDITEKRRAEQKIAYMAHHDSLTDLPNRAAFNAFFAETICTAAGNGESFAILSIDLARFKETNDVYGHSAGDALLQEVAQRLRGAAPEAFIARIGGDEFTLIVTGGPQPETAAAMAQRLLIAFSEDFTAEGKQIQIGLGIGGAVYPTDGTDAKTLMVHADAALYRAKASPHVSVQFFQPEMGAALQERHNLQHDLRQAIGRNELLLHYQPQFRITGEAVGFEALARWHSPMRGIVPPSTFIPVAEEYSLIIPLGEWALREACREAASWAQPLTIAVNVSPIQFHHGDLPSLVHTILLETGLAPARLELEITEGVLINDFSRAVSILRRLKALGVQIALDDFGKGYSSLSYLHAFAFDKIKIDRAFVSDLENNHHSMAIVRAVIGLGQSLKIPVLAEGVETDSQRALLLSEGCDQIQGYLAGRPFPIGNYATLVGGEAAAPQAARIAG